MQRLTPRLAVIDEGGSFLMETRLLPAFIALLSSLRQSASARASKQSEKVAARPGQHEQMPDEVSIPQTFVNEK